MAISGSIRKVLVDGLGFFAAADANFSKTDLKFVLIFQVSF